MRAAGRRGRRTCVAAGHTRRPCLSSLAVLQPVRPTLAVVATGFFACSAMAAYYLFFSLPLGITVVVGGVGRVDVEDESLGRSRSFFGFFDILSLRCTPLGMMGSSLERSMYLARRCTGKAAMADEPNPR